MATASAAPARVTEIAVLLRPHPPRKMPESLSAAAMDGNVAMMQLFLERGSNIDARSFFASALTAACSAGQTEAVRWLIAHGAVLNPPGAQISPIQSALGKMNCEVAAVLLDAGLPLEKAAWGVMAAAQLGRLDVLQWLVARGVDLDANYPGVGVPRERALFAAGKAGKDEITRFLKGEVPAGPGPATPPAPPLLRKERPLAHAEERAGLVREAVELVHSAGKAAARWQATGPSATTRSSMLSHAAGHGCVEIVGALLDAGAVMDFPNDGTEPPLARAAGEGHAEVVNLLLARGALPNGHDGKSWLPLEAAVLSGVPEVVRLLLEAGANPKGKPASGGAMADRARGPYAAEIRSLIEQSLQAKQGKKKAAK
jgi:hypothetical protein